MPSLAQSAERDLMPDLIRAFALIGIVLVNVETFASGFGGYTEAAKDGTANHIAHWLVSGLFTMKSYSLFSLMFGAGLGYQLDSAHRSGVHITGRYYRRMIGLGVLGMLHAVFFFIGDILVTYALIGSLLFLFRNGSTRSFLIGAAFLISLQILIIYAMSFAEPETTVSAAKTASEDDYAREYDFIIRYGSFFDAAQLRLALFPLMLSFIFSIQGFAALGYFLLGLTFQRLGLLSEPHHRIWFWSRWVLFPTGLIASMIAANGYVSAGNDPSMEARQLALILTASGLSSLGYVGWIAKLCQLPSGPVLRFIARGGSATLTAYLMQSVILCFVFMSFGFGLFGQVNAAESTIIAFATGVISLGLTSLWLLHFRRGPMEILLRRWTCLGERPQAKTRA